MGDSVRVLANNYFLRSFKVLLSQVSIDSEHSPQMQKKIVLSRQPSGATEYGTSGIPAGLVLGRVCFYFLGNIMLRSNISILQGAPKISEIRKESKVCLVFTMLDV